MRRLLFVISFLTLVTAGCSSSSKKETTATPAPISAPAAAPEKKAESQGPPKEMVAIVCERDSDLRTLKLESISPKGCKLWYSNYGDKGAVAWSDRATTHCEKVRDQIRDRLVQAGYKCSAPGSAPTAAAKK